MTDDDVETRKLAVQSSIMRAAKVGAVEFDEDGEHVYLVYPLEAVRYRLGPEVQRFLHGEFPELPNGGLGVLLLPPIEEA